jgi:hypothetical protein
MTQARYVIDQKRKFGYFSPVVNAASAFARIPGKPAKFIG